MDTSDTMFGDLNGPLMYWGPAAPAARATELTAAEQAVLLRLRARLESVGSGTISITEALDTILDAPRLTLANA